MPTIAIMGHWIDRDFRLHEALLSFDELQGTHDGKTIAEAVYSVLDSYNITDKFFCVTTDNASNNDTGVEHLSIFLKKNKGIEWNHKEHHVRCLNHVINIAVPAFLQRCQVLSTDGTEGDLDVENIDDFDDDLDDEEMEARQRQANDPIIWRELKETADGFETTMQKLRDIAKVYSCSAQNNHIND